MKERYDDIPRTVTLDDRELGALLATVAWIEDEPMAKSLSGIYARAVGEDEATTAARYVANRKGAAFFNPPQKTQTPAELMWGAESVGPSCTDALSDAARGAVSEIRTLRGRIEVSTGTALANAALAERYHLQLQEIRAWRANFNNQHGAKIVNEFGLNGEYRGAFELLDSILENS